MDVPVPNAFHRWFAEHLKAGGAHVTMNLDGGIEHAFAPAAPATCPRYIPLRFDPRSTPLAGTTLAGRLVKLHGSFLAGDSLESVGLLLHGIGRGFQ